MSVSMGETDKNFENPAYEAGEQPVANSMATAISAPDGTNKVSKHQSMLSSKVH